MVPDTVVILLVMNEHGHHIRTLVATGGDAKNPLSARARRCDRMCHRVASRTEAVLLGSAMLGAVAAGAHGSILRGHGRDGGHGPRDPTCGRKRAAYHDAKHKVFHRMYEDQIAYRELMAARKEA